MSRGASHIWCHAPSASIATNTAIFAASHRPYAVPTIALHDVRWNLARMRPLTATVPTASTAIREKAGIARAVRASGEPEAPAGRVRQNTVAKANRPPTQEAIARRWRASAPRASHSR